MKEFKLIDVMTKEVIKEGLTFKECKEVVDINNWSGRLKICYRNKIIARDFWSGKWKIIYKK